MMALRRRHDSGLFSASPLRVALLSLQIACAVLCVTGCAKHQTPTAPPMALPPQVTQVFPLPRSVQVDDQTLIWADFATSLDPSTVDVKHISLQVDTRRIPISISYNDAIHRVTITPQLPLGLLTTYTVILLPTVATADGGELGAQFLWQFTISGLRRLHAPYPADSASGESPFARLAWVGTDDFGDGVAYDVFAGLDSAGVANRSAPALARVTSSVFLPQTRWTQDTTVYWSIRETNLSTGENRDGQVWRFQPLPSATPFDSVVVPVRDWLFGNIIITGGGPFYLASCNRDSIVVGSGYDNGLRWSFAGFSPGTRLAGAALRVKPWPQYQTNLPRGLSVFQAQGVYPDCPAPVGTTFVPPVAGSKLASGQAASGNHALFASDYMAAFVESEIRHGGLNAVVFSTGQHTALYSPGVGSVMVDLVPTLTLYVYQPGPGPERAVVARAGQGSMKHRVRGGAAARREP